MPAPTLDYLHSRLDNVYSEMAALKSEANELRGAIKRVAAREQLPAREKSEHHAQPRGPHGLARGLAGCRCYDCWMALAETRDWKRRYMGGETLQEIGDSVGLTRERVRQRITRLNDGDSLAPEKRRRLRMAELEAAAGPFHRSLTICAVCGTPTPNQTTCGGRCSEDYSRSTLHYYHSDDGRRLRHRKRTARWIVENEDSDPSQVRYARRLLNGADKPYGRRWLIEGSHTWDVAMKAFLLGGSVVSVLPAELVSQLRRAAQRQGLVPGDDWREDMTTCEECGELFEAKQDDQVFCSRRCYYDWTTGRPASASAKASR